MTTNNSVNMGIKENADGGEISLGVTARILKWLGAAITLTGSGTNVYTFPAATSTLIGSADASWTDLTDGGETALHSHAGGGGGGAYYPFQARLTLETGVPISIADQTAKTVLYLTAYQGETISLYDGVSAWDDIALGADKSIKLTDAQTGTTTNGNKVITGLTDTSQLVVGMLATGTGIGAAPNAIATIDSGTQVTLSVNSTASAAVTVTFKCPASTVYDVFAFNDAGAVKLELVAGTATRALQNGVDVKTAATTRRLVGTILTTATAGQLEVSKTYCSISNVNSQLPYALHTCPGYSDDNANTTYNMTSLVAYAEANGGTGSRVTFVLSKAQSVKFDASVRTVPANGLTAFALGVDTITSPTTAAYSVFGNGASGYTLSYGDAKILAAGSHYISMLFSNVVAQPSVIYADANIRLGASTDPECTFENAYFLF